MWGKVENQTLEGKKKQYRSQLMKLKTCIPKASESMVNRERIMNCLEQSRKEVIIFQAGAGFGKTTVMAEWARKNDGCSSWYRMNESDNDPDFFVRGLTEAFSEIVQEEFLNEEKQVLPASEEEPDLYEKLLNMVFTNLSQRECYLCFDNFDVIKNEIIYELIQKIIEYGAGNLRILFTMQGSFPAFLASYLMHGEAQVICSEELCFEKEETRLLLGRIAGIELTEQMIRNIQEYTEGWPAGIVFAGLSLKKGQEKRDHYFLFDQTHLYEYIFHEVFRKMSYEMQQFIIFTSVFDTVDPFVCNYVFHRNNSESMLDYLVRENMFLYQLREDGKRYRYHFVFREFLKNRIDAERRESILIKASEYYAHHEMWKKAVCYAISCGEKGYGIVSAILEKRMFAMLEEDDHTLETWIDYLEEGRKQQTEKTLFLVYQFYRYKEEEKEAINILYEAAELAYSNQHYEIYAQYMCELTAFSRKVHGIIHAEEYAVEAGEKLRGKVTSYCSQIVCYRLEFRLQLEDEAQLQTFLKVSEDRERRRLYRLEDIRNTVRWALNLGNNLSNWEKVIEEARFTVRISKVYAEYGFYRSIFFLYWSENTKWVGLAKEGIQIGGDSTFCYWMRLLLLLFEYEENIGNRESIVKNINYLEMYRKRMGTNFPDIKPEDKIKLERILSSSQVFKTSSDISREKNLLKVVCLGAFSVEGKEGEIAWRTRKTKELFACLFFEEGRGIDKDILMERLWPGASMKKASTLFHTTVSYLRKALTQAGTPEILTVKNGSYAVDMNRIASDIDYLVRLKKNLDKDNKKNIENITEILEIYHGSYMHGDDYCWLGGYREYVEKMFLQTLGDLAERNIESGDYGKAVLLLKKAVNIDCYAVSLSELLIVCLILSGDIMSAKKQYQKLKVICLDELGQELEMEFNDYVERGKLLKEQEKNL